MARKKKSQKLYQCPECGFWYKEKEWAEKCQKWCSVYKSCNLEITAHAVKGIHPKQMVDLKKFQKSLL